MPAVRRRVFLASTGLAVGAALLPSARHAGFAERRAWAQVPSVPAGAGTLTWFGQSCFLLETARGTRVLMDPIAKGFGFPVPTGVKADLVTISHEHADHANLGMLASRAHVIHGLTADKKGWLKIDERFRDVSVRSVGVYHDDRRGADRGLDTVFIFEAGGLRLAHLGDLGHILTDEQRSDIGAVDVVLLPVGGGGALDAEQATQVMQQLRPRLMVIPMHYHVPSATPPAPAAVEDSGKSHIQDDSPRGNGPHGNASGAGNAKSGKGGRASRSKVAPPAPASPPPPPYGALSTVEAFVADKTNVRRVPGFSLTLSPVKPRPGTEIVVLGTNGLP